MSNILEQYSLSNNVPLELKSKVLRSARLLILARDLGELFTVGLGEAGRSLTGGREKSDTNKQKKKE